MKVGILGTGDVGKALGKGFIALGHEVMLAGREAKNEKAEAWAKSMGPKAHTGSFKDAAKFGDLAVIAVLGSAIEDALKAAGPENFEGKLVVDTTNPLDFSQGMPPRLVGGLGTSAGERVQKALPGALVVKAWNSVGNALMYKPELKGGPPDMFICGDDADAKKQLTKILTDFGWNTVDVGGIGSSHYLEALCLVWVISASITGTWNHAFKFIRP